MKLIKEIVARICALWAILLFTVTLLIFMIPFLLFAYYVKEPKKNRRFIELSRWWMGVFLPLSGCPLTVKGKENFARGENYIVICNHNSLMDVPISSPAIPGGNKTIAKIEMAKIPVFGLMYRTGSVLVDRRSDQSRKDSYNKMKEVLQMGLHMCIYPEGTRNKSKEVLGEFHGGAFRLAADTKKALLPGVIFHTKKVLPANKTFYFLPHKLEIHFLPTIPVLAEDTADTLKTKTHSIMKTYLEERKDY